VYDQAIPIPQFGANTIAHFFGLISRRLVIVGSNHHRWGNLAILLRVIGHRDDICAWLSIEQKIVAWIPSASPLPPALVRRTNPELFRRS
jgi:hypothetical protein